MGKVAPDAMIDTALAYLAGSDRMIVCSAEPTSYANATGVVDLATVVMIPGSGNGDFLIGDGDASGRKLTMTAKAGNTIDHTNDATHIALCKVGDTTLRGVTTCTQQTLTAAGTVDVPSWKWTIADPT